MIIVTGGAGFIGSNIIKELNERGRSDILVVDNLKNSDKFRNLVGVQVLDYLDKQDFLDAVVSGDFDEEDVEVIFHQGACSDTMEYDGRYMMQNNFEYSKLLLNYALDNKVQFIYASSAATYGNGSNGFTEGDKCEDALNVYGFSKLFFDRYVRQFPPMDSQVVGLKYFDVYGPQEAHKGRMAPVAYQFYQQLKQTGVIKLFKGVGGYPDGEQKRDFIYVKDLVNVNMYFWERPELSGIFNCGTGCSESFNEVARAVIAHCGKGRIEYVPFPENLKGKYQSFTQADTKALRLSGYSERFKTVAEGVKEYCEILDRTDGFYK